MSRLSDSSDEKRDGDAIPATVLSGSSADRGREDRRTHPPKWTGVGLKSYDDKQAGARLSQCMNASCGLWFWFTQQPAPDLCIQCREAEARRA